MERAVLEKYAAVGILVLIVLFGFYIRNAGSVTDRILSYDPTFQYRFTKYFVDFGELPLWDELSYYVGRAVSTTAPPLIFYVTAFIHFFTSKLGWTLFTTASFASALYGALVAVPAFLLGRELSNKWGGLMGAALTVTAPQVLVRTFGASFDTDQFAIFFILITLWAGIYALRKRDVFSISLATGLFLLFEAAWQAFWYTFFFMVLAAAVYLAVNFIDGLRKKEVGIGKAVLAEARPIAIVIASIFVVVVGLSYLLNMEALTYLFGIIGFANQAENLIVNISIAELQLVNIFSLDTWMTAAGRFIIGEAVIDNLFFLALAALMLYAFKSTFQKSKMSFAFVASMFLLSFFTLTRGVRFTEFSSGLLIAVAAIGFGHLLADMKGKDVFFKGLAVGVGVFLVVFAFSAALLLGQNLGPDINGNWDSAWNFLRTQTPELSLVGTWWDPGHMITGLAERRVIADGAHCNNQQCLYGINDRIVNLGKIMATSNETLSVELINKYKGTSPKVYWIASDDLISKYQWLQYFGLGCNAATDQNCMLYSVLGLQSMRYDQSGKPVVKLYGPLVVIDAGTAPVAIYIQNNNAALVDELLYYDGSTVKSSKIADFNRTALVSDLTPLVKQLGYRLSNQTVSFTAWISKGSDTMVAVPPNLRNTVFTRMFLLEGQGLEHFTQVFRNEQVKIYEVKF